MKLTAATWVCFVSLVTVGGMPRAVAQSTLYYAGRAVGGQQVVVDLGSIYSAGAGRANFTYSLGAESISSQATCAGGGSWMTLDDGAVYYPQSEATQNMVNVVCGYLAQSERDRTPTARTAWVYDPPSNVRANPNGQILCTVNRQSSISIFGRSGDWYFTNVCGDAGVIHESQVRF